MSERYRHDEELNDLAARLAQLVPTAPGLQRDSLLFEAGRRAGRRQARRWNVGIAGVLMVASISLTWAVALGTRERPGRTVSQVRTSTPAEVAVVPESSDDEPETQRPRELPASSYLAWRTRLTDPDWREPKTAPSDEAAARQPQPARAAPSRRALERTILAELLGQS